MYKTIRRLTTRILVLPMWLLYYYLVYDNLPDNNPWKEYKKFGIDHYAYVTRYEYNTMFLSWLIIILPILSMIIVQINKE